MMDTAPTTKLAQNSATLALAWLLITGFTPPLKEASSYAGAS